MPTSYYDTSADQTPLQLYLHTRFSNLAEVRGGGWPGLSRSARAGCEFASLAKRPAILARRGSGSRTDEFGWNRRDRDDHRLLPCARDTYGRPNSRPRHRLRKLERRLRCLGFLSPGNPGPLPAFSWDQTAHESAGASRAILLEGRSQMPRRLR